MWGWVALQSAQVEVAQNQSKVIQNLAGESAMRTRDQHMMPFTHQLYVNGDYDPNKILPLSTSKAKFSCLLLAIEERSWC